MPQIIEVPGMGQVEFPDGMSDDQIVQAIQRNSPQQQAAPESAQMSTLKAAGRGAAGLGETALQMGAGMVLAPIAGLAGIATGGNADVVRGIQEKAYQPKTAAGQGISKVVTYPLEKLAQGANYAGEKTAAGVSALGAPPEVAAGAGAGVNTFIQALPAVLLRGMGKGSAAKIADPAAKAESFVNSNTRTGWSSLPAEMQETIKRIAKDSGTLGKLDPAALERQARMESLKVPVKGTSGQITRDPVQLRNEGNVSATKAGQPIRDIYVDQNKALLDNLEVLKGNRSKAASAEQVGESVQGAARTKLKVQEAKVKSLYQTAEKSGELQGRVSVKGIQDLIENSPDKTHYGYAESWINKIGESERGLTLKQLEDLRSSAVARAMDGGTEGYYAGKLIREIDAATDGAGGTAYKAARAARKAQAMEFEEQGGVANLVENKSRTDRATALEDTWRKTVKAGSIEDLRNVKRTLLTGDAKGAGRKAWRDVQAQTLQHIIDESTKSVARFEDGTPNVTPAAMQKAINSIGRDKLNEIFSPATVRQIDKIMEVTRDVKTEPPAGHKGSSTAANIMALLEKSIGKVPVLGHVATGTVKAVGAAYKYGKASGEVKAAQQSPLNNLATQSENALARYQRADLLRRNAGLASAIPPPDRR